MSRLPFTLARAKQLAMNVVKDNDAHAEELIELFVRTGNKEASATTKAIRTEVLKTWYDQTEHYRDHFREFVSQFEENDEDMDDNLEEQAIESNAPAS